MQKLLIVHRDLYFMCKTSLNMLLLWISKGGLLIIQENVYWFQMRLLWPDCDHEYSPFVVDSAVRNGAVVSTKIHSKISYYCAMEATNKALSATCVHSASTDLELMTKMSQLIIIMQLIHTRKCWCWSHVRTVHAHETSMTVAERVIRVIMVKVTDTMVTL